MSVLIRQALADLNLLEALDNKEIIDDALSYFNRQSDHEQIRDAIIKRYGTGIKSVKNPGDGTGVNETYVRGDFEIKVETGQIENFSIGFAPKIVGALATLFTEKNQINSLAHETVEDVKAAEKLLFEDNRGKSTYASTIVEVDKMSVQVGSAALLVEFLRGRLSYKKLSPGDVKPYYSDYVTEEGKKRTADRTDIEDATAIVINLGTNNNFDWNYLAIFGRSEIYPNGRYVQFQGPEILTRIPDPGENDAIEHEIDGDLANPLTWWGNQPANKDRDIPEYPIIVFKGGVTNNDSALPTYTSLFEVAKEFDISASHAESSGQQAASGTRALERTHEAMGNPIPPCLTGDVSLTEGQTINNIPHDSASCTAALEITEKNMIHAASGYGVPDYMVISQDHTLDASSGVALAVKTQPLTRQRDYRISLNRPAVMKMFEVEKAYIAIHAPLESNTKEADINLLLECSYNWDPGEVVLPENKNELATRLVTAKEKGLIDEIAAIRMFNQLASDEEAMELYEKMKERAAQYPSLAPKEPEKKKALGLPGRTQPVEL